MSAWITTYLGRQFFIMHATVGDIYIEDIAHGLSNNCRYTGQCSTFYSVAEHSVRMSKLAPDNLKLPVLMHDAPEAYLNDLPSLVKRCLPLYIEMEEHLLDVIFAKYFLKWDPLIKLLDEQIRTPEVLSLFPAHDGWEFRWTEVERDYGPIKPWSHRKAEKMFLEAFYKYVERRHYRTGISERR